MQVRWAQEAGGGGGNKKEGMAEMLAIVVLPKKNCGGYHLVSKGNLNLMMPPVWRGGGQGNEPKGSFVCVCVCVRVPLHQMIVSVCGEEEADHFYVAPPTP